MGSMQTVTVRKYKKVSVVYVDDSLLVGCVYCLVFSWFGSLKKACVTSVTSPRASKVTDG